MDLWILYLITVGDNLRSSLPSIGPSIFIGVFTIVFICFGVAIFFHETELSAADVSKGIKKYIKIKPIIIIISVIFCLKVFIPTKDQVYEIIGAHYATNIEGAKDLSPNVVKAMNRFLEQYTEGEK